METLRKARKGGTPEYGRAERQYRARYRVVEDQARLDVTATEVDQERADKAAYMRDYRARKRAVRRAVDARRATTLDR
jgi:hypothetical protein